MTHGRWLFFAMLLTVLAVGFAMFLDERREFEAAFVALRDEQVALATALGADFEARLERLGDARRPRDLAKNPERLVTSLLGGAIELQQPRLRLLLVHPPGQPAFLTSRGTALASGPLTRAVRVRAGEASLSRQDAAALGLPARLAAAGLRHIETRDGTWSVVVLASAERLRTRERHAQQRFLLGLGLVTVLVGGLGALALRDQRRRLAVARELEIAALQRERERLLAKADKMATLAALSSGIAHQIATPLGTIMARVEQVQPAVAGDTRATSALGVIYDQVLRIQRLIRGVLDLARGNQPSLVRARPENVAQAALELVKHRFESEGLSLQLEAERNLPAVACDSPLIEQALVNLLLNALEASRRGARVLTAVRAGDGEVCFLIEDDGEGISDETAARAAEPFFTTKAREQGTGLGLAIAQEVVANHGGRLILERRPAGRGTRATIALPTAHRR